MQQIVDLDRSKSVLQIKILYFQLLIFFSIYIINDCGIIKVSQKLIKGVGINTTKSSSKSSGTKSKENKKFIHPDQFWKQFALNEAQKRREQKKSREEFLKKIRKD